MQDFPHQYTVTATGGASGDIKISGENLSTMNTAPPVGFGGPGNLWSPETLLVASLADCYTLTFRAIARESKVEWSNLRCDVTGTLDKVDKVTQFTHFVISTSVDTPEGTKESTLRRILEKAKERCLISNSLTATKEVVIDIQFV